MRPIRSTGIAVSAHPAPDRPGRGLWRRRRRGLRCGVGNGSGAARRRAPLRVAATLGRGHDGPARRGVRRLPGGARDERHHARGRMAGHQPHRVRTGVGGRGATSGRGSTPSTGPAAAYASWCSFLFPRNRRRSRRATARSANGSQATTSSPWQEPGSSRSSTSSITAGSRPADHARRSEPAVPITGETRGIRARAPDVVACLAAYESTPAGGAWRSPVARLLWEQEVPSSNLGAPTIRIDRADTWPGSRTTARASAALSDDSVPEPITTAGLSRAGGRRVRRRALAGGGEPRGACRRGHRRAGGRASRPLGRAVGPARRPTGNCRACSTRRSGKRFSIARRCGSASIATTRSCAAGSPRR